MPPILFIDMSPIKFHEEPLLPSTPPYDPLLFLLLFRLFTALTTCVDCGCSLLRIGRFLRLGTATGVSRGGIVVAPVDQEVLL